MSARGAARLAWSLWAVSPVLGAVAMVFYVLSASIPLEGRERPPLYFLLPVVLAALLAYATVGAIVASRRPGNAVGWILCAVGVLLGIVFFAQGYADYTLVVRPGSLPGGPDLDLLVGGVRAERGPGVALAALPERSAALAPLAPGRLARRPRGGDGRDRVRATARRAQR